MKTCGQCHVNYPDAVEFCPQDGNRLPEKATKELFDPLIGSTIDGRYIVESLLGQGGMGYVYAARHAIIDKRVAIKVLRADHASTDESAAQRFLVEAKAASKIGHQNIVDITDFGVLPAAAGSAPGHAYFVMEFLDGPTLGKLVHKHGSIDARRSIAISIQIARGLQAAHDKQIIHRDLKPENIFILDRDGQKDFVKIVDFGIAKDTTSKKRLTQAGMVLGTPEYMSPEQATGQPTDHRVDMYALGCILYEMLCGEVPFKANTPTKTLTMHVFEKPVPPSVRQPALQIPPALEQIVMRAILKKPTERYADLREMIGALERVQKSIGGAATNSVREVPMRLSAGPSTQAALAEVQGPGKRRMRMMAMAGLVAVVLAGAGLALTRHPAQAVQSPEPAPAAKAVEPAAAAATAPAPVPAPAAPAPAEVEIQVTTTPAGAEVLSGDEKLGVSPLTFRRPRAEQQMRLTIRRAGYKEETRELVLNVSKEIIVTLSPASGGKSHAKSAAHAPTAARGEARSPAHATPSPAANPTKRVSDLRDPFAN